MWEGIEFFKLRWDERLCCGVANEFSDLGVGLDGFLGLEIRTGEVSDPVIGAAELLCLETEADVSLFVPFRLKLRA
jgi:hypothetical protein